MTIADRQNRPENLELMAAARQLYSEAKRSRAARAWIAVVLAVAGLAATSLSSLEAQSAIAIASFIFLALSPLMKESETDKAGVAASIQEQFDVVVLGLEGNEALGTRVTPEEAHAAAARFGTDRSELKDWYQLGTARTLPEPLQALLCQRCNVVWDAQLRKRYGAAVLWTAIAVTILSLVLGAVFGLTLSGYVAGLVGVLPAVIHGVEVFAGHRRIGIRKNELAALAMALWDEALKRKSAPPGKSLRCLQSEIFHSRATTLLVPDRVARWLRPKSQAESSAAMQRLAAEALQRFGQQPADPSPAGPAVPVGAAPTPEA